MLASRTVRVSASMADDVALQHPDIRTPLEQGSQRVGDLPRRQRPGRHLIGQRLEQVEVAAISILKRDLDVRATQALDGAQTPEPASDDDDTMAHGPIMPKSGRS